MINQIKRVIFCPAVVCLLAIGSIYSDTGWCGEQLLLAAADDLSELSLEQLMQVKVEKVVTASRFSQRVTEAPASMTVITSDDIRKYGYRTLADVLRSVPGLYVSYDRNYSYLGVRGFSRPGDFNSRILLQIDGHRLNDNIFDTAAIGTEFPLDIDLIDHIEFMRGPGSSLYGSNAFFGVINIITRKGDDVGGEISASGAMYKTWNGRTSYGASSDSGMEVLLSGTLFDSPGKSSLYFPEFASSPSGGYTNNSDYDSSKSVYARFSQADFTLTGLFGSRKKGIPTGAYGTVFNDPRTRTIDERGYLDLAYHKTFSDSLKVSSRVYYDHYAFDGVYITDNGTSPSTTSKDTSLGTWWGGDAVVSLTPLADNDLSVGVELRQNMAQNQKNVTVESAGINLDDRKSSVNWGLFVQDEYHILKPLRVTLGVRYDKFDSFDAFNPRAALVYTPAASTALKLLYGEAFRTPNVYELYYHDGSSMVENPALKPEKIRTVDAIWEQYFLDNYRSSIGAFYYRVTDLISSKPYDPVMSIYRNTEKTEAVGVALSMDGAWKDGYKGRLSYDWQQATYVSSGVLLSNSPRHLAKANVSVPLFRQLLFLSPELQYTGARKTIDGGNTNDPIIANLTVFSRDLGLKGLEVSASVYNLFDAHSLDVAGEEHSMQTISQDGINFRFKLSYRF